MKNVPSAAKVLDGLMSSLRMSKDNQLAEFLGVSAQAVSQARKKDKVPDSWLIRAALHGNVSLDTLLLEKGAVDSSHGTEGGDTENQFEIDFCLVPLVAARLSAGGGSQEVRDQVLQQMAFRRSWIQRKGNPENMVMMRVHGDSMEPYIQHGDLVLVDESKKNVIPHSVFAVGVDDGIYIKSLETLPGQRLVLRSFNERYAPIEVDMRGDLAESIRIIGTVLWWCHEA